MYDQVPAEFEARDLSLATLGALALIGNTAARYGGLATVADEKAGGPVTVRIVRVQTPTPDWSARQLPRPTEG